MLFRLECNEVSFRHIHYTCLPRVLQRAMRWRAALCSTLGYTRDAFQAWSATTPEAVRVERTDDTRCLSDMECDGTLF